MGVTLLTYPRELSFTRNPLGFELKGENYIAMPGIRARLTLQHTSALIYGESFTLSFLDYSLTFWVVGSIVDDSGLNIASGSTTEQIVTQLNDNFYLSEYYDISFVASDEIKIDAKQPGSDFNMTVDFSSVAGLDVLSSTLGYSTINPMGYKLFMQLFIETYYDTGVYDQVTEMYLDLDANGRTPLRLEDITRYLFPYTDLPELSGPTIKLCMHTVKRYYIKVAEYYGNPAEMKKLITSDIYFVLNGQVPVNIFPGVGFHDYVTVNKNFLITGPLTKYTWESASQYLYFFNPNAGDTNELDLCVEIFFTDGTSFDQVVDTYSPANRNQVYWMPVGYTQLDLGSAVPAKTIYKYKVSLNLGVAGPPKKQVAAPVTFNMIPQPLYAREFLFQNRYGVYETLLTTGKQKNDLKTKRQEFLKELAPEYTLQDSEVKSDLNDREDIFTCSTGFKRREVIEDLKQCLISENFFILKDGEYVRCRVIAGSFKIYNENEDLFSLEFKYSFAFKDTPINDPGTTTNLNYYSRETETKNHYSDSYKH